MGEDHLDPWSNLRNTLWQFNPQPPNTGVQKDNSAVFSLQLSPFMGTSAMSPVPLMKTLEFGSPPVPTIANQKKFLVLNQSENPTSLIYGSFQPGSLNVGPANPVTELQASNGTDATVLDGSAEAEEEMHEDTEEINALLYSDSDYSREESEEQSTAHSPVTKKRTLFTESVASSVQPSALKRRKLESDIDQSLVDTASSIRAIDSDTESRVTGEGEEEEKTEEKGKESDGEMVESCDDDYWSKRLRREKIQGTVNLLRKIIPGGPHKDSITVLDEAICYLKYLRIKAKALRATSL